jgi:exportin-1
MIILRLLSEEVFDYSAEQMTSTKTKNMKQTMCAEFSQIFQLCQEVLTSADTPSLIKATLETLLRFCNWIPLGYIFETTLIETLRTRFLSTPEFRNVTLQVLTEIGGLQTGGPGQPNTYDEQFVKMFTDVLTTIADIIPVSVDLRATYPSSNARDQEFVQNLALFLCNFFSTHLNVSPPPRSLQSLPLLTRSSSSRTCPTATTSSMVITILLGYPKSRTARFSRSASTTGSSLFRNYTRRCNNCRSRISTR